MKIWRVISAACFLRNNHTTTQFHTIEQAVDAIRTGGMIIIVDDEHRENEGDLVMAAEDVSAESMAFIIRYTGGVACLALDDESTDRLELPPMTERNTAQRSTAFTVSIDAAHGITTGISARDRAHTARVAADPKTTPDDLARPGHIFPLRAKKGGVLHRAGHTEAAVDMMRFSGKRPLAVISELMHDSGDMMRLPEIRAFAAAHNIPVISVGQIIAERRKKETLVHCDAQTNLPTEFGDFLLKVYTSTVDDREHVVLQKGDLSGDEPVLVRVHSACMTGEIFHSKKCDCREQLSIALVMIAREGRGVLLYMPQEGRGIGLTNKIKAYALQEKGYDTVDANIRLGFAEDLREYGIGAQILADLGITTLRLLTNNPKKMVGLQEFGLTVAEQIPIAIAPNGFNNDYLRVKKEKLGHLLGPA